VASTLVAIESVRIPAMPKLEAEFKMPAPDPDTRTQACGPGGRGRGTGCTLLVDYWERVSASAAIGATFQVPASGCVDWMRTAEGRDLVGGCTQDRFVSGDGIFSRYLLLWVLLTLEDGAQAISAMMRCRADVLIRRCRVRSCAAARMGRPRFTMRRSLIALYVESTIGHG
jgi:hypothetical protein